MLKDLRHSHSLLNKMVLVIFLFALLVSLLTTAVRYSLAYTAAMTAIHREFDDIAATQIEVLTNSAWSFNEKSIEIQLHAILGKPDVVFAALRYDNGDTISVGVRPDPANSIIRHFDLGIDAADGHEHIGEVVFHASTTNVSQRIRKELSTSLGIEIIGLFVTCLFILGLFYWFFSRHLQHIVAFTARLSIDSLDERLTLSRRGNTAHPDELDRIAFSLNDLSIRLCEGLFAKEQAEKNLLREKTFSDTLINSLPLLFFVFNQDMRIVRYNRIFLDKIGIAGIDVHDLALLRRVRRQDRGKMLRAIKRTFSTGESINLEATVIANDSSLVPYVFSGTLLEMEGERYLIGLGMDLSERKKIEDELRQAQKLEAIGTLAGGIAHDFNNILSALFGYVDLLRVGQQDEKRRAIYLDGISTAARRARELVQQILTFSRKTTREKKPVQIGPIIKEALKLLRASMPATIDIHAEIASEGAVFADPTQIHQIIMNLCTNSFHAMKKSGGKLTVSLTETMFSGGVRLPDQEIRPGRYLILEVSDTGHGMDKETQRKIFDPYFTTKETGVGTGLGLAVVHGIVSDHNGHVAVYSEPGQGTTFRIYLPRCDREIAEQEAPRLDPKTFAGDGERIMVVDDEEEIRFMLDELLSFHGYRVRTFANANQALEVFYEQTGAIDIVLTDLTMPGLSGMDMGRKMLVARPGLPLILCTGFNETLNHDEAIRSGFHSLLRKPVEPDNLLRKIREALDEAAGKKAHQTHASI